MKATSANRRKPETVKVGNIRVKIYARGRRHKRKDGEVVHYQNWEVEDYTAGRRRFRSFADHAKAVEEATRIANQLSTGQVTAAQMLNSEAASYGRGIELLKPTGASLELACATFAECYQKLGGNYMLKAADFYAQHRVDQITPKTVAEAVLEFIELKRARKKSARYIGDLSARLSRFAADFAVDIDTITTPDVARWIDRLAVAPQTAKNFQTVIGTLFSFAESRGYIIKGGNPVDGMERIQATGGAIEIYTPDEIRKLLKAASPEFRLVLALGAFAGLRTAEITRLEFKDFDGHITVAADKAKTRSRRPVPILPNLREWLKPFAGRTGKIWQGDENDLRDARAAAVAGSGVAWKDNGARHSFISYRLADIQNESQVALEAGNSPKVIFRHYRELVKPEAAREWFAIVPEQGAK